MITHVGGRGKRGRGRGRGGTSAGRSERSIKVEVSSQEEVRCSSCDQVRLRHLSEDDNHHYLFTPPFSESFQCCFIDNSIASLTACDFFIRKNSCVFCYQEILRLEMETETGLYFHHVSFTCKVKKNILTFIHLVAFQTCGVTSEKSRMQESSMIQKDYISQFKGIQWSTQYLLNFTPFPIK